MHRARRTDVDVGITGAEDRFAGMLEIFVDDALKARGDTERPVQPAVPKLGGIEQPLQRHHGAGAVGPMAISGSLLPSGSSSLSSVKVGAGPAVTGSDAACSAPANRIDTRLLGAQRGDIRMTSSLARSSMKGAA